MMVRIVATSAADVNACACYHDKAYNIPRLLEQVAAFELYQLGDI